MPLHISSDVVRPVERALADLGAVLPALDHSHVGVELCEADALMDAAAEQLGGAVGVEVAARIPLGALGPVDYVLSTSGSVREGLTTLSRFYGIATERIDLTPLERPRGGFALTRKVGVSHSRYWIEFSLALILGRLREGVGSRMKVDEVAFAHPSPGSRARHESFFGAPVRFDAPRDQLTIPLALMDAPLRTSAPFLAQVLTGKLEEIETSTAGDPILRRLCKVLSDSLDDRELGIDEVARVLGMSRRSLQRHLGEHGTTFRIVVDEIRCQRANRLLAEQRLSPAEIAQQLGFADASAFFRAFRRWTGETPGAQRARASRDRVAG